MNETIKTGKLKQTCALRKGRNIQTTEEIGLEYEKAVAVKTVLHETFDTKIKNIPQIDIKQRLTEEMEKIVFPAEETRAIAVSDAAKYIKRYSMCETRVPEFASSMDISVFDMIDLTVKPDYVFRTSDGIEVVKIRTGKNHMKKKEMEESLELYAMLMYAQRLVPVGFVMPVKASYYFLRRNDDDISKGEFAVDFFGEKGKNIVSYQKMVDKTVNPEGIETGIDEKFKELYSVFAAGTIDEEVTKEECEACDFKNICGYKRAPQYIEKEHKVKSIKDLTLTPMQEKAIAFRKGLARINAGAGAGKTLVVALRVVTLLLDGVKPEEICLLTFTNSGADEMKERVQLYNIDFGTGADTSKLVSRTFNGFANDIVMREYSSLGFTEPPTLIDDVERLSIIAEIIRDNYVPGIDYRNFNSNMVSLRGALAVTAKAFSVIKTYSLSLGDETVLTEKLNDVSRFISSPEAYTAFLDLYSIYDARLKSENLIEYADQELLMFEVYRQDPYYFDRMGLKHIIVDEFQDSNQQQLDLIKELSKCSAFESLMVVGDDSQSIFSFRDTTPEFIINFFNIMGEAGEDFYLLENHRSVPEIIELANKINALNIDKVEKDLVATRPHGKQPVVKGFFSKAGNVEYTVEKIKEKIKEGKKPEDIAYIASDKYELLEMGTALTEAEIPWVMLNPEPVLENSKVIAIIALAKAIKNPENTESMITYLNALFDNELLKKTDEEINALLFGLKQQIMELAVLSDHDRQVGYHELAEALDDDDELFQSFIKKLKYKKTFEDELKYLLDFELYGAGVTYKRCKDYPGVVLTTAHSSKGLEWDVVFANITKFHGKALDFRKKDKQKMIEEKRRLLFVTITRARDELFVTGEYTAYGPADNRVYNMFLRELYECMDMEYVPEDPDEIERVARKKEEAKVRAKERREAKKAELKKAAENADALEAEEKAEEKAV